MKIGKVGIIDRGDYRQGKFLMMYYANWQRGGVIIDQVLYKVNPVIMNPVIPKPHYTEEKFQNSYSKITPLYRSH